MAEAAAGGPAGERPGAPRRPRRLPGPRRPPPRPCPPRIWDSTRRSSSSSSLDRYGLFIRCRRGYIGCLGNGVEFCAPNAPVGGRERFCHVANWVSGREFWLENGEKLRGVWRVGCCGRLDWAINALPLFLMALSVAVALSVQ